MKIVLLLALSYIFEGLGFKNYVFVLVNVM